MISFYKNLTQNLTSIIPYVAEFTALNFYSTMKGHPLRDKEKHKRLKKKVISLIEKDLIADAKICSELNFHRPLPGINKIQSHFKTLGLVFLDYNKILQRRSKNDLKTSSTRDYPKYFNRNFHFQTDGYTSEFSASIYDHQVEILFAGLAAPMRRLILEEVSEFKEGNILELACGTGSATEIVANFLPDAKITATDLSHEYISFSKKNRPLRNVEYKQMDATKATGEYDCTFHVFLLHELPTKERNDVLLKQIQSLKVGGKGIIIESLQVSDVDFLNEVLYDFPKYYHEPFFKSYIENSVEKTLESLGAKNIKVTKRLFSKCISFSR